MSYRKLLSKFKLVLCATSLLVVLCSIVDAERFRYIDEAGNIFWVDSLLAIPERYRYQVLKPTPIPDEATIRWMEQRRREKEREKLVKKQEEERKRRELERKREQVRLEREREAQRMKNR
jgi:hypothetical protein